jgi:Neprosin
MSLKWQLWQGNWWLRVNGVWIGYYPATLFNESGLRSQAGKIGWYGEVVDAGDHAGTTATDMGNGHWPYEVRGVATLCLHEQPILSVISCGCSIPLQPLFRLRH